MARAITDVDLVRIDDDLLDVMATWEQLAGRRQAASRGEAGALARQLGRHVGNVQCEQSQIRFILSVACG
jgi:hypothetical protein